MIRDAYSLAMRFLGIKEESAVGENHPLIMWWLSLCKLGEHAPDETPWCSAFVNGVAWMLGLSRSGLANARSWLTVGTPVALIDAERGNDVVVLQRGQAPNGHVGFFSHVDDRFVYVLGGNQGNAVSVQPFPKADVLGVRRLTFLQ